MKKIQKRVKEFSEKNKIIHKPEIHMLDLVSEIGEISKEILKSTNYGKNKLDSNLEIKNELGDALYSLIVLANSLDIDLEEALNIVLKKYEKRLVKG